MSVITERSINAIPESLRQKTVHGKSRITETIASPKPLGYLVDLKKKKKSTGLSKAHYLYFKAVIF